jgi:hypothetical protein
LILEQVGTLLVDLFALTLQENVQALALETGWSDGEVDKCDARAQIGSEDRVLISCQQEQSQLSIAGDLFVTDLHHESAAHLLNFLVEDAVHDRVNLLNILH